MGNTFGRLFRVTTFGESHGPAVGCVLDGCPSRLSVTVDDVQRDLDRRRPGQSKLTTQRKEGDRVEILSGLCDGQTLGTPIAMLVRNEDARSRDYDELSEKYRPSHADYTYQQKYGIRAWQGGGRSSARETVGRVAAGTFAKKLLVHLNEVEVVAWVDRVADIGSEVDSGTVSVTDVDAVPVRCPDKVAAEKMTERIESVRKEGDSVGGVVACVVRNVPTGWGVPVFDRLEADLAKALLSLPASKGFEIGSGFAGTALRGSEHNDAFRADDAGRVSTPTNRSGGVQGGISNGMPILLRVAFKPVATIMREQDTVTVAHENTTITGRGRHDACVLPRAVPMVEAMVALVLADHALLHRSSRLD
ncbi:MAG: chorismate synthase [Armatimonadetes bacterium]|nr:chorismate synthase [Armatimonadota bacterium]